MIYPLVIHPDFFHSIYGKEIPKNFNKFYQKLIYDDSHREKFFFIDDLNDTIQNLYKDIIKKNVLPGDPIKKIILEELIKQVTGGNIKRKKLVKKLIFLK